MICCVLFVLFLLHSHVMIQIQLTYILACYIPYYSLAYILTQSWRVSHERQGMLTLRPTPDSMEGDLMDKNLRLASKFLC